MDRFTMSFELDNEPFRHEDGSLNLDEVAEVLAKISRIVGQGLEEGAVMDSFGNRVGRFEIEINGG